MSSDILLLNHQMIASSELFTSKMTNSPRMDPIEKRRMQNRIAQRNHRRRAKENMLRYGSNEEKQPSSALPTFNTPPGNSNFLNQDSSSNLPISKEDTVSGSLAPRDSPLLCQSHMDAHVGNEMMLDNALLKDLGTYPSSLESPLTVHQRPQTQCSSSAQSSSMPNPTENTPRWTYCGLGQPFHTPPDMPLYSPPPIPVTTANQLATPQSLLETNRGFSPVANRAWVAGSNGAGHRISNVRTQQDGCYGTQTESPTTLDSDSLSLRYQYVLDHVRRAGFESFDAMVSGYYTSSFSKNSTAECAQKVSRAKRLRSVLQSLHKHSREWTRWEARGFQEQVVEAAEDIYVAELDRVQRDSGLSMHGTMGKGQSLGELQRLYQNKAPNLWALFTELAGASSPQTEDATVLALTLLHSMKTNPESDIRETIIDLLDRLF